MSVYPDTSQPQDPTWTPPGWTPSDQPQPTDPNYSSPGYDWQLGLGANDPSSQATIGNPANQSWWQAMFNHPSSFGAGAGGLGGSSTGSAVSAAGTVAGATIPQWLQAINAIVASTKSGKFVQVPQTPQQQALYNWAVQRMTAMPDNTANLYNYAAERALSSPKFDINAAMSGKPAYTASVPLTPAQLATVLQGLGGSPYGGASFGAPPPGTSTSATPPPGTSTSATPPPAAPATTPPPRTSHRFPGGIGAQGGMQQSWGDSLAGATSFGKPAI